MAALGKLGKGVLFGGLAMAGLAKGIGSSAREAAMDAAFGDPNADESFLGGHLSARYMAGAAIGGNVGAALQWSNPSDRFKMNPIAPNAGGLIGATAVGGIGGAIAGAKIAGRAGGGARAKLLSGIAGAAIGSVGGSTLAMGGVIDYAHRNKNFFMNAPHGNQSSATAAALNASGNIVLGMHNSRNGY